MLYFKHSFISDHITIHNHYFLLSLCKAWSKLKMHCHAQQTNECKKVRVKNCTCYFFDDIITFENFDFDTILIDENFTKIFWFIISHKKL